MARQTHTGASQSQRDPRSALVLVCEGWYAAYAKEVWAAAYARTMDKDLAYDLTQECFLRAWQHVEKGETLDQPRAWLLRVVRNLAEDTARSSFRKHGTVAPESLMAMQGRGESPPTILIERELFARIRETLAELEPSDREILTMRYALDYDAATIAERLDVPLTAIHMRLSRARKRLGDRLGNLGGSES